MVHTREQNVSLGLFVVDFLLESAIDSVIEKEWLLDAREAACEFDRAAVISGDIRDTQ